MDDIKDKFSTNHDGAKEAFEELCGMVDSLIAERDEKMEVAKARQEVLRTRNGRLRERNRRLRAKYAAMVDAYNELAEEVHDRSDSSSSDESDDDDNCSIM